MILLRILLLPFSLIYFLLTTFRNHLFDIGYFPSFRFDIRVIAVGNLRVGGTGKTPHVEYLIRLLKSNYQIATLSRGYGRKTKGFILADEAATADTIGDEPLQFYRKFKDQITVAVGEERALAIPTILFERQNIQVILLDDAYQHRTVIPDLNILLSDYNHPFYKDMVLPSGRLRESRSGSKRADVIVVSKCPENLSESEREEIRSRVQRYAPSSPVFFTGIKYQAPQPLFEASIDKDLERILLVSGIANSKPLQEEIKRNYILEKILDFGDHHSYSEKSIRLILKHFEEIKGNHKAIFTTEKDMVKLKTEPFKKLLAELPVYYLPIEIYFHERKEQFDQIISDSLRKKP